MKNILLSILLLSSSLNAVEISRSNFFAPSRLGEIRLFHNDGIFSIEKDGQTYQVNSYDVASDVKNLSSDLLAVYLGTTCATSKITEQILTAIEQSTMSDEEKDRAVICLCDGLPLGYLSVSQYDNGDYIIHAKSKLLGGGAFGAFFGAITGKFIVHAIVGGTCGAIGLAVTPFVGPVAGYGIGAGIWGVVAPVTEATSTAVALAGGIAAGVVTGPV